MWNMMGKIHNPRIREWLKWVRDIVLIAFVIFGARSAIADWNHVPTASMKPTIIEGDMIFVNRLAYDLKLPFTTWHIAEWGNPRRGEIIVFYSPANGDRLVKRVVGMPGDRIAMHGNRVFINDKPLEYFPLDEKYAQLVKQVERSRYRFSEENLGDHRHPIMALGKNTTGSSFQPITVPSGKYLVLGDNRDNSGDSRYFGFVDRKAILGRATTVIASWNPDSYYLPRGKRFFLPLP